MTTPNFICVITKKSNNIAVVLNVVCHSERSEESRKCLTKRFHSPSAGSFVTLRMTPSLSFCVIGQQLYYLQKKKEFIRTPSSSDSLGIRIYFFISLIINLFKEISDNPPPNSQRVTCFILLKRC